jgi:hypothetical protein
MSYPEVRYRSEKGEISAMYRPADQKPELAIGSGTAVRYLATGASTHGQFDRIGGSEMTEKTNCRLVGTVDFARSRSTNS